MAVPKRSETARRQRRERKLSDKEYTDYSKFLSMDYDYKNGILNKGKLEQYIKLKEEYGNK